VTVVDLVMNAYAPELHRALGIFVPLIVVNCIILGRAEAFAGKNGVWLSLADGIGMGVGFTIALIVTGAIREISGNGTLTVWGDWRWNAGGFNPALLMVLAPGGFITLGWILGVMNHIQAGIARAGGRVYTAPPGFDCRHCIQCRIGGEGRP
jgi:electron transport complex protein RnfE